MLVIHLLHRNPGPQMKGRRVLVIHFLHRNSGPQIKGRGMLAML